MNKHTESLHYACSASWREGEREGDRERAVRSEGERERGTRDKEGGGREGGTDREDEPGFVDFWYVL